MASNDRGETRGFKICGPEGGLRAGWEALFRKYFEFYEAPQRQSVIDSAWNRIVEEQNPHGLLALDGDRRVVGLVHYLFHPSTWTTDPYCYLQDLYVDESWRGKGVGRALIEAVYRAADEKPASQVYWLTQHFNTEARQLYDRVAELTPFIKYKGLGTSGAAPRHKD
ncbi:MAG: GNAT family N-acetyltransferase [Proteobacteria bacterium]|nr:GNAT family N-acetyltransferase [Pseudomonadota bacterium]